MTGNPHQQRWSQALDGLRRRIGELPPYRRSGRIVRATGMVLEAVGLGIPLGGVCRIELAAQPGGAARLAEAEVVGFAGERLFLMPLEE
ncbi:flagellum-specific ATP synthase FliI, partial [Azotobacter chroococcum]|nr:flagellum-specific ATP synthase FliI [Azotobacter chroococcum]